MGLGNEVQLIVFKLGNSVYAVDIRNVREVIEAKEVIRLPRAPPYIEGIMNLRGHVVTLVNLAEALGEDGAFSGEERKKRKVLISMNGSTRNSVGFIVDYVLGVLRVNSSDIEKPPIDSGGLIKGVVKHEGKLIIVLDLNALLSEINLPGLGGGHA